MEDILYKLDNFEGPLDLLLQLIAKNKLDILDIPIAELTDQYLIRIENMRESGMELSSSFVEMASRLIYMKTVHLLPRGEEAEELKRELTGELIEYAACREAAENLAKISDGFLYAVRPAEPVPYDRTYALRHDKKLIADYYSAAVGRGMRKLPPKASVFGRIVAKRIVAVKDKIGYVLQTLAGSRKKTVRDLCGAARSRSEVVATFLAVLELCKDKRVLIEGAGDGAEIVMAGGSRNG